VAIPVFAYIWYNFEINTNASRARKFGVHRHRAQIRRRLEPIPHDLCSCEDHADAK
jgi:hypothetical protein